MTETKSPKDALSPGYYTPPEIYALKEKIRFFDMFLFATIQMLDNHRGCFASNTWLAAILDVSESSVSHGITRLQKIGLVENTRSNKGTRVVRVKSDWHKRARATSTNVLERIAQTCDQIRDNRGEEILVDETLKTSRRRTKVSFDNEKKENPVKVSDEVLQVITTWNRLCCGVIHSETSKAVERAVSILENKLLDKYGLDKILSVLNDYKHMLERPGYFNVSKKKSSIDEFFELNSYTKKKSLRENRGTPRSLFERLIRKDERAGFLKKTDDNKNLTKGIKKLYGEEILGSEDNEFSLSLKQECDFIEASVKLKKFARKKKYEHVTGKEKNMGDYVLLLFNALAHSFEKYNIKTGNLNSDYTYNDIIPRYLKEVYEQ